VVSFSQNVHEILTTDSAMYKKRTQTKCIKRGDFVSLRIFFFETQKKYYIIMSNLIVRHISEYHKNINVRRLNGSQSYCLRCVYDIQSLAAVLLFFSS